MVSLEVKCWFGGKARHYTVTARVMSATPPSCPRRTCSRHHLRRSPPSSSCNSLQERSSSLSIKPLCALPPHGTATIQFELLLSTTLFLSREGVRTSLLRQQKNVSSNLVRNISLLPAYVGVPIAVA